MIFRTRTLPNVRTGANLTLTILTRLQLGHLDRVRKYILNRDGASDNVTYTNIYTLVHLLLCAEENG